MKFERLTIELVESKSDSQMPKRVNWTGVKTIPDELSLDATMIPRQHQGRCTKTTDMTDNRTPQVVVYAFNPRTVNHHHTEDFFVPFHSESVNWGRWKVWGWFFVDFREHQFNLSNRARLGTTFHFYNCGSATVDRYFEFWAVEDAKLIFNGSSILLCYRILIFSQLQWRWHLELALTSTTQCKVFTSCRVWTGTLVNWLVSGTFAETH